MRRREFITLLGGTAATWPRAQQPDTMRRIGVLMSTAADDAEGSARIAAFLGGRSAAALSRAWLGPAAMPPDSASSNTAWAGNGWSCSRRSRPA